MSVNDLIFSRAYEKWTAYSGTGIKSDLLICGTHRKKRIFT